MDQAGANQEDTRLEFHEAMRDFRKMFPTIEGRVIEAVLRVNNGAVDDTIDQLLVISLEKEENAFGETLPKRIGDLATAFPRVDIPPNHTTAAAVSPAASNQQTSTSLPSYWLLDVDDEKAQSASAHFQAPSTRRPDVSPRPKKIYRPPLVGSLPRDFLRISSSSDPWERPASAGHRSSPHGSNSGRRSTLSYDARGEHEKSVHEGPPPPYAVAVGRRFSERAISKTDRPHHAYLGVFRTTTMPQPPSPRRTGGSDRFGISADYLQEAMAENKWRRRVEKDPELSRYLEDERIALMLQNEEFIRHLRNDRDFMAALEKDAAEARLRQSQRMQSRSSQSKPQREHFLQHTSISSQSEFRQTSSNMCNDDLPDSLQPEPFPADPFPYTKPIPKPDDVVERSFQDKLGLMGRASKQKFATMARRFIRKSKGAKGVLDNSESRTHALLLDSDDDADGDNSAGASAGYNQPSDADYNIGHQTDLKQGRLF